MEITKLSAVTIQLAEFLRPSLKERGDAVVSWYDRRTATTTDNDLTRYMTGGAAVKGPNLVALPEIELSGVDARQATPPVRRGAKLPVMER